MKIKVCGLTKLADVLELKSLGIDYLGFIFYEKSTRNICVSSDIEKKISKLTINKVGVFVNEKIEEIKKRIIDFNLDYIQFHGNESVEFCKKVTEFSKVIKVFKVDSKFDFSVCKDFLFVDYFLFETKGILEGGNGIKFNWKILNKYQLNKPFFLSGGIGIDDVEEILNLNLEHLEVVDLNSGFEIKPGSKNIELLKQFKNEL